MYSKESKDRDDLFGDDSLASENQVHFVIWSLFLFHMLLTMRVNILQFHCDFQHAALLDNTERLDRTTRKLEAGYKLSVETGLRLFFFTLAVPILRIIIFLCVGDSNLNFMVEKYMINPKQKDF